MDTLTTRDADLLRIYSRENLYEPCEREETRYWDDLQDTEEGPRPGGKGLYFRIIGNSGGSQGNPGDGGDWSRYNGRDQVEGHISGAQIDSVVEFSLWLGDAEQEDGSYGDAAAERVLEATRGLYQYADLLLGCGHKTGRLAVVGANAGPTDTITLALPESGFQLRRGHRYDIVDLDTGGTVQEADVEIVDLDTHTATPTVTFNRNVTVVSGWGIYKRDVYGNPMPNGRRNIVDDGDLATAIFDVTRSTAPYLNATVMDNNGSLQNYSLDRVRRFIGKIASAQDFVPTQLVSNEGIINEHLKLVTADTFYNVTGNTTHAYPSGANQEKLHFQYGDKKIPFRLDRNYPARELLALYMPAGRRAILRKANWIRGTMGTGGYFHIKPQDGGGGYTYACVGTQLMNINQYWKRLNCNGKLSNLKDGFCAGDE